MRPFCGYWIIEIKRAFPKRGGFRGVNVYVPKRGYWAEKMVQLWEAR
jgi:hypothetical protein